VAFRGTFEYSLDTKNRLTVPARFRSSLSDGVVLAKQVEGCLAIWKPEDYEAHMQGSLAALNPMSPEVGTLQRFFSANAHDVELDAAGRIGLPPSLIRHAQLDKEVVVIGAGPCLEIWARAAWDRYNKELADEVAEIRARFSDAG